MNTQATAMPATNTDKPVDQQPRFGAGRYSDMMVRVHKSLHESFNISDFASERIARNIARQHGEIMKQARVDGSASKPSKDNKITVKETVDSMKRVTGTPELFLLTAVDWIGQAFKNGINFQTTGWELSPVLAEFVAEIEKQVAE